MILCFVFTIYFVINCEKQQKQILQSRRKLHTSTNKDRRSERNPILTKKTRRIRLVDLTSPHVFQAATTSTFNCSFFLMVYCPFGSLKTFPWPISLNVWSPHRSLNPMSWQLHSAFDWYFIVFLFKNKSRSCSGTIIIFFILIPFSTSTCMLFSSIILKTMRSFTFWFLPKAKRRVYYCLGL